MEPTKTVASATCAAGTVYPVLCTTLVPHQKLHAHTLPVNCPLYSEKCKAAQGHYQFPQLHLMQLVALPLQTEPAAGPLLHK